MTVGRLRLQEELPTFLLHMKKLVKHILLSPVSTGRLYLLIIYYLNEMKSILSIILMPFP